MKGLAQQLFAEREQCHGWKSSSRFFSSFQWPFVEKLLAAGQINEVDFALAEILLRSYPMIDESVALFICHLSISARAGHLCVKVTQDDLSPDPSESWLYAFENQLEGGSDFQQQWAELRLAIRKGAENLPLELLWEAKNDFPSVPICRFEELYYLQRYWLLENQFLTMFSRHLKDALTLQIDEALVQTRLVSLKNRLLPEQSEAILKSCLQNFTIISGGPGTGKTYTAGHCMRVFWESLDKEQQQQCQIALAAPTGKAASNLEASIQGAWRDTADAPEMTAHTLHSLLGIRHLKSHVMAAPTTLPYDLLIVDESSMIDVGLMGRLMAAVKPGSRLILLGDRYQLPPVEAGSLFSDLISHFHNSPSLKRHVVELKTCLRTELRDIVDLAGRINQGDKQGAIKLLISSHQEGVRWVACDLKNSKQWQRDLLEYASPLFPKINPLSSHFSKTFQELTHFRVLSPYRKGPLGVEALNHLFLQASLKSSSENYFAAPIIIVKNDYRLGLFNGEMGILVSDRNQKNSFALFPSKNPNEPMRSFSALLLPKFEYAYCLSVYKSQGSEFDHVLLVLPESLGPFGRELLYTAVTRARKQLEIWGSQVTLEQTISRHSHRLSGISRRFGF